MPKFQDQAGVKEDYNLINQVVQFGIETFISLGTFQSNMRNHGFSGVFISNFYVIWKRIELGKIVFGHI